MADASSTTTAPADDGRAHIQPGGRVHTGGRPAFVWVEDEITGHRYDVPVALLPRVGLVVIDGYPLNFDGVARPAKIRMQWEADPDEPAASGAQRPAKTVEKAQETAAEALTTAPDSGIPVIDSAPATATAKGGKTR